MEREPSQKFKRERKGGRVFARRQNKKKRKNKIAPITSTTNLEQQNKKRDGKRESGKK